MDLQDVFISNLKRIRKERHVTQEKLADMCGTDTSYIGQIEIKKRFPSLHMIEKIASALQTYPYVLFKDTSKNADNENYEQLAEQISSSVKELVVKTLSEKKGLPADM